MSFRPSLSPPVNCLYKSYNCRYNTAVSGSRLRSVHRASARCFITRFDREGLVFERSLKVTVEVTRGCP